MLKEELEVLETEIRKRVEPECHRKISKIRERILNLWRSGVIKSNHSIIEFVLGCYLISKGYDVEVEVGLSDGLVCDIYASNSGRVLVVEVETGFVPPEHALDPVNYRFARELSKIARYSKYADEFGIAVPPYHILQIPSIILKPAPKRTIEECKRLKTLLDLYYKNPPISIEDLKKARLDVIYVVTVDESSVIEFRPVDYIKMTMPLIKMMNNDMKL
ncbi:MAG: hypothetical protein DRJ49_00260 [Thermoprotei archaeon]|nr:MAG: hypothetical protein DRJ49_00260 [Thermoprotei archaeon]